jgi:putative endonuclease
MIITGYSTIGFINSEHIIIHFKIFRRNCVLWRIAFCNAIIRIMTNRFRFRQCLVRTAKIKTIPQGSFYCFMLFYTYILYSPSLDVFYKGSTRDLDNRILRHNNGKGTYTRKGTPWKLIWSTSKPTRSEAYKLEMKLKNLSRKRLMTFILKYSEGIACPDELHFIMQLSGYWQIACDFVSIHRQSKKPSQSISPKWIWERNIVAIK